MSSSSSTDLNHDQPASSLRTRRLPVGAEPLDGDRAHFRVWAPAVEHVAVVVSGAAGSPEFPLAREDGGYHSGAAAARAGDRYQFRLGAGDRLYPDPASRFQPDGPHGASQIVDPRSFRWTDERWAGVRLEGQVIYELHAGTFTREGTWTAATRELPELAAAGLTVIELMPIAEFEGRFGWGYDGVDLFAPFHGYGTPDELREFVDRAHALGMGVILDAVYNHLGPSGNYLRAFAPAFFTDRYSNDWGDAINFDGPDAAPVREFFVSNAAYWIDEYHVDGLRLDATQQIFDRSQPNIIAAIGDSARAAAGRSRRSALLVAENEPQDIRLVKPPADDGYGLDAVWNDDFHHSAMVALTGRAEAYYSDMQGEPQEFIAAAKYGYLFQGQFYSWQSKPRGSAALGVPPARFVTFLQNHDQVANTATGLRGHEIASPGRWRAMTALLLLMPGTPMLFQGQEFSASAPFLFFADFEKELAEAVREGRRTFMAQFPSAVAYQQSEPLADPGAEETFRRCKLDFGERRTHAFAYDLHKDLIRLRRETPAFSAQRPGGVDGAVLAPAAFMLRFFMPNDADHRLLLVNLGPDLSRKSFAEPLIAPPPRCEWQVEWSTEDPRYGGLGTRESRMRGGWSIPSGSAIVLGPRDRRR